MDIGSHQYIAQDRIVWGVSAGKAIRDEAERRGAKRLFIITGKTLNRKTSVIADIGNALGDKLVGIFDECLEHTPRETVVDAACAARRVKPDLIVSVGGGTVIDTAKVVLVALAENISDVAALDRCHIAVDATGERTSPDLRAPPVRQIAVSTTLSGAEFSCLGGAVDQQRHIKDGYYGAYLCPAAVILDPAITLPTPEWLWLSTGIRALDHAVESICSRAPNPLVDACALRALSLLSEALPRNRCVPDDLEARLQAQQGAWLASQGILRVDYGASHGIGHSLGAITGLSHGYTSCVLLPAVLRWNREQPENRERQKWVAEQLGDSGDDAAASVETLIERLGLPGRLRDLGIDRSCFDSVAQGAMGNLWVNTNPRAIRSREDILSILEAAY
ncbi:iron-containing alcohol dehydrogenase [Alcanivorax balearicus MACL04]|uniref:Iron-containing alcohol dehydrogenase n=1 Tax=Alloalcanivorax balearicus MACL04 TaxID=1177182 RepID=A0ABT2QVX4_9GAMM|nr:iron-containing alcohol dehydrogenase [Alloalcanivorax balearicus]MCU5781683.1 iron-containing alcohol dehydrogenase [Alloalcanivorax balearicus MACL04]